MPAPDPARVPFRAAPLVALAPCLVLAVAPGRARAQSAAARPADTAACAVPTGVGAGEADERGTVLVTLGGDGAGAAPFRAWNVDVRLEPGRPGAAPAARAADGRGAGAEVRLTRRVDAGAEAASRLRASGQRLPVVWLATPGADSAGGPAGGALRVRLTGVTVTAQRLAFPEPPDGAAEQAAALSADVCQLAADRADAARRLAELEALDRRKLAAAFELARLGDQGRVLDARLAAARRRLALLTAQAARAAQPTEELTLRAERAEVLAGGDARGAPAEAESTARPRR